MMRKFNLLYLTDLIVLNRVFIPSLQSQGTEGTWEKVCKDPLIWRGGGAVLVSKNAVTMALKFLQQVCEHKLTGWLKPRAG